VVVDGDLCHVDAAVEGEEVVLGGAEFVGGGMLVRGV
jgi:hypothetical protein